MPPRTKRPGVPIATPTSENHSQNYPLSQQSRQQSIGIPASTVQQGINRFEHIGSSSSQADSAKSRPGRQPSGASKKYEPSRLQRNPLNLTNSTSKHTLSTPRKSGALNDSSGSGLARRTGPKSPEFIEMTPTRFQQTARNAAQRAAECITTEPADHVMEIHSDHSCEDELVASGNLSDLSNAQSSKLSGDSRTPGKNTTSGVFRASNFRDVVNGFDSVYHSPSERLSSLKSPSPGIRRGISGPSNAKPGFLAADSPNTTPTQATNSSATLVASMRPSNRKSRSSDDEGKCPLSRRINNKGTKRQQPISSRPCTASAAKDEGLPPTKTPRKQTARTEADFFKEATPMGRQTLDLFGEQIGRYFQSADGTKEKSLSHMRLIIRFFVDKFELTTVGEDGKSMQFRASEIDAVESRYDGDIIVMRMTPKPTIESVLDEAVFDPTSADPELKHIVVGFGNTSKNVQAVERVWEVYSSVMRMTILDESAFETYKAKFMCTESIDISSDEDNAGGQHQSPKPKSTPPNSRYWSSISAAAVRNPVAKQSFLDPTKFDEKSRRNSSSYGLRSQPRTFMGEQSSADEHNPKDCISSDEEDAESRDMLSKYRSLDQTCLFEYPPGGHKRISVTGSDICRLFPREFLNDTTIEFYMRYISEGLRQNDPELYEQCYFFNTFFYRKLVHLKKASAKKETEPEYLYENMKKWTSSARLFDRKYIFVPINENIHWYLAIITNPVLMFDTNGDSGSGGDKDNTDTTEPVSAAPAAPNGDMAGEGTLDIASLEQNDTSVLIDDLTTDKAVSDTASHMATNAIDVLSDTEIALSDDNKDTAVSENADGPAHSPEFPSANGVIDLLTPQPKRVPSGDMKPATVSLEFKGKKIDIAESRYVGSRDKASILVLDSLGGSHGNAIGLIRSYMIGEARSRSQHILPNTARGKYVKVPLQGNMCDCGVFLLNYIEEFLKMPNDIVELAMNGVGLRCWFEPALMKDKRKDILRLASILADEYSREKTDTKPSDSASNASKSDVDMGGSEKSVLMNDIEISNSQTSGSKSDSAIGAAGTDAAKSPILSIDDSPIKTV
ncbi:hypothetical protein GGI15_000916 [Coemansia interrupta]|uniref:Ubiquitin-like protease family profile domain-containing protein n=1 Tax=Coemansia interrupta TaxID=1126814 RepID=A0A9W8HKU2_9FUNG|nr:hypothetical protein GGI15_000916 [Coemansia interrupta]